MVLLCEAGLQFFAVLVDAFRQVIRVAGVKCAVALAGEDVNPEAHIRPPGRA